MANGTAVADRLQARSACGPAREWGGVPLVASGASAGPSWASCEAACVTAAAAAPPAPPVAPAGAGAVVVETLPPDTILSIIEHKAPTPCGIEGYGAKVPVEQFVRRVGRYGRAKRAGEVMAEWLEQSAVSELSGLLACGQVGRGRGQLSESAWLRRSDLARRAGKLRECSLRLWFREYFTHPDRPVKLSGGVFCQQPLLCQGCALHRSAKLVRFYRPRLAQLAAGGLLPYFVTLTARSGDDLAERFKHLDGALSSVVCERRKAVWNGSRSAWASISGGVFSFEAKRGEGTRGGGWHPHIHGVLLAGRELADGEARDMVSDWCERTGDSAEQAQDIRPLECLASGATEVKIEGELSEAVGSDLLEVFKYPLKVAVMAPADRWEAVQVLRRRRLIRSFGCLRGMEPDGSYLDEFDGGDLPYFELLARYVAGQGVYAVAERRRVEPGRGVFSLDSGVRGGSLE